MPFFKQFSLSCFCSIEHQAHITRRKEQRKEGSRRLMKKENGIQAAISMLNVVDVCEDGMLL